MFRRLFLSAVLAFSAGFASADALSRILSAPSAPKGVVIEIVEGDESALRWALPEVERLTAELRAKFPDLPVAVVSHGAEQFALAQGTQSPLAGKIRRNAKALAASGTPLHVCGGHAEARGVSASAFPAYVDVAPSGPAKITEYINQGYELIILRKG